MAAKVFGTIFVIADQQTLDCSIVRACPRDWWIVTASIYNAKFRPYPIEAVIRYFVVTVGGSGRTIFDHFKPVDDFYATPRCALAWSVKWRAAAGVKC
jgi:hypothetical protein